MVLPLTRDSSQGTKEFRRCLSRRLARAPRFARAPDWASMACLVFGTEHCLGVQQKSRPNGGHSPDLRILAFGPPVFSTARSLTPIKDLPGCHTCPTHRNGE